LPTPKALVRRVKAERLKRFHLPDLVARLAEGASP
jgi:hypothetical protein